jgi:hypothetical protein
MPLYTSLHNLLNVLVQIASKMGLRKRFTHVVACVFYAVGSYSLRLLVIELSPINGGIDAKTNLSQYLILA